MKFWNLFKNSGEFVNLKQFCERMKEKFWPDWDDCLYGAQK